MKLFKKTFVHPLSSRLLLIGETQRVRKTSVHTHILIRQYFTSSKVSRKATYFPEDLKIISVFTRQSDYRLTEKCGSRVS